MEITVKSREMIKPSTPTPHHLKHLTPSLIDQYMIPTYFARILLFYSAQGDVQRFQTTNMSYRLRQSLSKVLSEFYPLAGRFNNVNQSIECTDHGLEYIEARVKAPLTLAQLLACPKPEELDRLIPYDACNYGTKGFKGLSAVQVTVFDECGGMAVGVSLSHLLADAASLAVFINTWAATARGEDRDETVTAKFGFASLFPPRDIPAQSYDEGDTQSACRKLVVKRFVFSQSNIDSLKAKFDYHRPTRVEVVSALLIKCLINAIKSRSSKPILSGIAINLRTRMNPPLPVHYVGNMALSLVMNQVESESESLNVLGVELRRLIKEIDSDYLEKLQADNALLLFEILEWQAKVDARIVGVTSWCKFPVYEADVGWGAPTWAAPVHPNWEDCIVLMDAKNGEGIEAWATLGQDEMALFESDSELLEFACHNRMVCEF